MAATSHPLATLAAVDTLRAGGTAADAAVTAVAVLCVVEPQMTGIGGDCFCLVSQPGKPVWGYNGSGRAGARKRPMTRCAQGHARNRQLDPCRHRAGRGRCLGGDPQSAWPLRSRSRAAAPRSNTPRTASRSPRASRGIGQRYVDKLDADPGAAKHYLFNGAAPKEGDVIRFPALAQDAEDHRRHGRARLLRRRDRRRHGGDRWRARGSFLTAEDFARIAATPSTPISTNYRGLDLVEIPPNGQGLTALVMLNILENFDIKALDPLGPERFHLVLEAARLGLCRARHAHRRSGAYAHRRLPICSTRALPRSLPTRST